jgi:hypothetical protein
MTERVRPTPVRFRHLLVTARPGWGTRRQRVLYPLRVLGTALLYAGCSLEIIAAIYLASLFIGAKP